MPCPVLCPGGRTQKATWTRDEGFIEVSEDYIAHDLVVNLYSASLDRAGYEKFEAFADNVHGPVFSLFKKRGGMVFAGLLNNLGL